MANKKKLMDLNDDCIRHILWKLSPTDLCSMSFTCKRIQELAFDHFPRQYSNKKITIASCGTCGTNVAHIRNMQNYLKYFAKCIQNIRIDSTGTRDNIQCLFDFVKTECCAVLRTLELSIAGRLKEDNTEVVKSHLKNVLTLQIDEPFGRYDIHRVLLQHCEKLEHLIIRSNKRFDVSWMLHTYPTLTRLTISVTSEEQIQQFELFAKTFIQLNPQMQHFMCSQNRVIKSVLTYVIKIEELTVCFTGWNQLQPLVNVFKECSKRINVKAFRVSISSDRLAIKDVEALQNLNIIQPIHSLSCFLVGLTHEPTFMSKLKFLEELYLHIPKEYGHEAKLLTILSEELSSLRDLRLNLNGREWTFKDVAMKFIENSTKMKFLNFVMCYRNTFKFHANDLVLLNERRSSPQCKVPIKIRMDYDDYENFAQPTFIQPAKSVVNISFVSMWKDDE